MVITYFQGSRAENLRDGRRRGERGGERDILSEKRDPSSVSFLSHVPLPIPLQENPMCSITLTPLNKVWLTSSSYVVDSSNKTSCGPTFVEKEGLLRERVVQKKLKRTSVKKNVLPATKMDRVGKQSRLPYLQFVQEPDLCHGLDGQETFCVRRERSGMAALFRLAGGREKSEEGGEGGTRVSEASGVMGGRRKPLSSECLEIVYDSGGDGGNPRPALYRYSRYSGKGRVVDYIYPFPPRELSPN